LVENHRCPPEIVAVANRLVAHNTQRAPEKTPTTAARKSPLGAISTIVFKDDEEERDSVAEEIVTKGKQVWGKIVILGRTRALLEPMLACLKGKGVNAVLVQRRDNFISPQFVWMEACLNQAARPTNRRVFTVFVNAGNRITGLELDPLILIVEAEAAGHTFLEHWSMIATFSESIAAQRLGKLVEALAQSRNSWRDLVRSAIPVLLETAEVAEEAVSDATDDHTAWVNCLREIRAEMGQEPELSEVVQGLALRSKEPPRDPNFVALLTIHTSKGLEFDIVYVIGLAEGEMPSWQSVKKGDTSAEMEEERRNCFVAVTRTREKLNLSYAHNYRGWRKEPSRFLKEMSLGD
jgi:DNA helicase-2/ATP-dependent DNA helicase PcrA